MREQELEEIADQLADFLSEFSPVFGDRRRDHWCQKYISGLLLDGERKSIEPLARRIDGGDVQSLQQFVNQSTWDSSRFMEVLRGTMYRRFRVSKPIYVLDDTTLPKKGRFSVGVAHQYCGALGKLANCQTVVSLQAITKRAHFPIDAQIYLPKEWTNDSARLTRAGVPNELRQFEAKWKIALRLLEKAASEREPEWVLFDAGYGGNREFLDGLDQQGLRFIGQCRATDVFWGGDTLPSLEKTSNRGRPRQFAQPQDSASKPATAKAWADRLFRRKGIVKRLTLRRRKDLKVRYVATRVFESTRSPFRRVGPARWLLIEELPGGEYKYYVSNAAASASAKELLTTAHERWKIEQGYQQLKEELGLDHFEGRSWRGLNHHICLCFAAYAFLQILARSKGRGKKTCSFAASNSALDKRASQDNDMSEVSLRH